MRLSITAPQVGAAAGPHSLIEIAEVAEQAGYDGIWVCDRLLAPLVPSEPYPSTTDGTLPHQFRRVLDPLATLTYLAAHTTHLSLGTSVLAIPWYSPLVLARQLATIDVLSGGRLKVGLGGGWSTDEHAAAGAPTGSIGARCDEFIETLISAWTDEVVAYDGRFQHVPPSRVDLKPLQHPHPPIYLAAYAPASMRRTARYASGWNPAGLPIPLMCQMFEEIRRMAADFGRDPEELELVVRANVGLYPTQLDDGRPSFFGTLEQISDDVQRCRDAGAAEVILDAQFNDSMALPGAYASFVGDIAERLDAVAC